MLTYIIYLKNNVSTKKILQHISPKLQTFVQNIFAFLASFQRNLSPVKIFNITPKTSCICMYKTRESKSRTVGHCIFLIYLKFLTTAGK